MKDRAIVLMGALAVAIAVASLASVPVSGQTARAASGAVAKTPWGEPDLQGMWDTRTRAPLERPKEFGTKEFMTEQEAKERMARGADVGSGDDDDVGDALAAADVQRVAQADRPDDGRPGFRIAGAEYNAFWSAEVAKSKISLRTSQIIDPPDGRMPPLTREALATWEAREKARSERGQGDSWEDRGLSERCIVRNGLPGEMVGGTQQPIFEIVQTPGYVTLVMPYGYVRIIPTKAQPHAGAAIRQWNGDSRGRWEGNTLVVETTNFRNTVKNVVPGHGGPFGGSEHVHYYPGTGETLRLTERFTRSGNTIDYRYTVDDPKVFVRPFTAVNTWNLDTWASEGKQDRMFEYACHEHNYGMVNALAGARADEAWAMGEAKREAAVRMKQLQEKKEQLKQWEASNPKR
jgi:hypothetical protein